METFTLERKLKRKKEYLEGVNILDHISCGELVILGFISNRFCFNTFWTECLCSYNGCASTFYSYRDESILNVNKQDEFPFIKWPVNHFQAFLCRIDYGNKIYMKINTTHQAGKLRVWQTLVLFRLLLIKFFIVYTVFPQALLSFLTGHRIKQWK